MITKTITYKTEDGHEFCTEKEAKEYELTQKFNSWYKMHPLYTTSPKAKKTFAVPLEDMASWLRDDWYQLTQMLRDIHRLVK